MVTKKQKKIKTSDPAPARINDFFLDFTNFFSASLTVRLISFLCKVLEPKIPVQKKYLLVEIQTVKRGWVLGGDVLMPRGVVVGGHPFPQLQLDAGEWPVIAVAWDGQQASNLRLFLTFRIATEQADLSGKNS